MKTIAFVTINNPTQVQASGIAYSLFHHLEEKYNVIWIEPKSKSFWYKILNFVQNGFNKILLFLGKSVINQTYITSYIHSKAVAQKLKNISYDAVFCLDCTDFAYLNINKPIFYRSDAIFHLYVNYYLFNVPFFLDCIGRNVEERALKKCTYLFSTNKWAVDNIKKFNIDVDYSKLLTVQSGANFDQDKILPHVRSYSINQPLNMIFIGYDLKRKGIDVAYRCLNILTEKYQINATLTIVGGVPEEHILNDKNVRYVGKINKNIESENAKMHQELANADLFIFPTKAEFSAIVNCEACAYGLPIFTYNTGGLGSYVFDDVNGRLLDINQSGDSFAEAIYLALKNNKMQQYSDNCHKMYNNIFNWNTWLSTVSKYIDQKI